MLTALIEQIKSLFKTRSYQDDIEFYVASKQPKTTAEVEYWIQHYTYHRNSNNGGWAL
jgi:hypothetical protein